MELDGRLAAIPKGSRSLGPMPKIPFLGSADWRFWRVQCVSCFWEQQDSPSHFLTLEDATQRLTQSLSHPFAFVVLHHLGSLTVGWAAPASSGLGDTLRGFYRDIELVSEHQGLERLLARVPPFSRALVLRGNPPAFARNDRHIRQNHGPNLDGLIRGLREGTWFYVVLAFPMEDEEKANTLCRLMQMESEIHTAWLRPGTALEKTNVRARTALETIQAVRARIQEGLRTSLWKVHPVLFIRELDLLGSAASLLRGLYGDSPEGGTMTFRVELCSADAPASSSQRSMTSSVLNGRELSFLVAPPKTEYQGYPVRSVPAFHRHRFNHIAGRPLFIGCLVENARAEICVSAEDLKKHLLVAGSTGSGKTTTCLSLLQQMWQRYKIPFTILETAEKCEYAAQLRKVLGEDVAVFTVGDQSNQPLHLDLLAVPDGMSVEAHIGRLMSIFKAAFPWPPPTSYILEEALYLFYKRLGWNIEQNTKLFDGPPLIFNDLLEVIKDLLHVKYGGYTGEIRNTIDTALLVRLSNMSLGGRASLFVGTGEHEVQWESLMQRPLVLELGSLYDDYKALAALYLLYRITAYARSHMSKQPDRLHFTVVEEAHRVLTNKRSSDHPDAVNTQAAVVEEFANALAEIRYAGEGLIIVDQQPSLLSPSVRANTNFRIYHRLTAGDEQEACAVDAGLDSAKRRILNQLKTGTALWVTDSGGIFHVRIQGLP